MSFVTPRKTRLIVTTPLFLSVVDFSNLGTTILGPAGFNVVITPGTFAADGTTFMPSAAATTVTVATGGTAVFHNLTVEGFDTVRAVLSTNSGGAANGAYFVGTVNKVTNF